MTITTFLAVYGAALSTLLAAYQVYVYWDRKRTKVDVQLFEDEEGNPPDPQYAELVVIRVTNGSQHDIWVQDAWLKATTDARWRAFGWVARHGGYKLPMSVEPYQQIELATLGSDVAEVMDTTGLVQARVRLGDNSFRVSQPTKINPTF